jgi:hypothetical protein
MPQGMNQMGGQGFNPLATGDGFGGQQQQNFGNGFQNLNGFPQSAFQNNGSPYGSQFGFPSNLQNNGFPQQSLYGSP